jgi:hypothetical protein
MITDIKLFENIFESDFCDTIIDTFQKVENKIPSYIYNNSEENQERKGSVIIMKDDSSLSKFENEVLDKVDDCIKKFSKTHAGLHVMINDEFILTRPRIEEINFEGGFDWHMDARQHAGDRRFLAILIYLNTVNEGGETEFHFQNCQIKPKQGSVLLFPPYWSHIHRGKKPISNIKYTIGLFATLK